MLNNTPKGRVTRKRTLDQFLEKQNLDTSSWIDLETKKLKKLVEAISQKLYSEVFGEDQKKIMTTLRQLCDIKELKRQIDKSNVPLIYTIPVDKFINSAYEISTNLDKIPKNQLLIQYRTFLETLGN